MSKNMKWFAFGGFFVCMLFSLSGFVIAEDQPIMSLQLGTPSIQTYWKEYTNYSSIQHYEPGFYHDAPIPNDFGIEQLYYFVDTTITNIGSDTYRMIEIHARFLDDNLTEWYTDNAYQYQVSPGETRNVSLSLGHYLHEDHFFDITNVEVLITDIETIIDQSTELLALWHFDEAGGNRLYDASGNNHQGIINGTTVVQGVSGHARMFNGVSDSIEIVDADAFNGLSALTISCWFNAESFDVWEPILNKGGYNEGVTDVFEVNVNAQGFVHFVLNFPNAGRQGFNTPSGQLVPGTWYHFLGTFDGDIVTLYIDGVQVGIYDAPNENLVSSDASLQIGLEYDNPPKSYFHGILDEITIYAKALNADQAGQLYRLSPLRVSSDFRVKENRAAERSILYAFVEEPAIPIYATAISIVFLIIWHSFSNVILEFFSDYISENITDKRHSFVKKTQRKIPVLSVTIFEVLNLVMAVLVFSIVLSWTWAASLSDFAVFFGMNCVIVGLIYVVREWYRKYYSRKYNLETAHMFWPFGAVMTLVSTVLGNTFSLASYTKADIEDDGRYGRMLFHSALLILAIGFAAFLVNFVVPSVVLQMVYVFAVMSLFINMVPIPPMDGATVRNWNQRYYMALFGVLLASYVVMNFNIF